MEEAWKIDFVGDPFIEFHAKLKSVKLALIKWSRATFGNIFQKTSTLEVKIRVREIQLEINATMEKRKELNRANIIAKVFFLKEEFWKQKLV